MELEVIRKVKVSPKTLFVYIPDYEDNVFHNLTWHDEHVILNGVEYDSIKAIEEAYPAMFGRDRQGKTYFVLKIDVETGQVLNWPKNSPYDFFDVKIVDTGKYLLLDKNDEVIAEYDGYVPECVGCDGYGDYLEFEIDSASNIPEWEFTQEHLDEFMKEAGDELYEDM
jgi:DNA-binding beta-propeller fold protein YncE